LRDGQKRGGGFRRIEMIETYCQITRELEMLCLVFANGNMRSVIKENVGGLENRIGKESELQGIFVASRFQRGCVLR
jgi:hypothetical protein